MTPERWRQVKSVFHQALEITPAERSSFLDRACSTDHSLRQEVESLLSSDQEAHSAFLVSDLTLASLSEGTRLGDYEVHSLLGSGGMGVVYRARDSRLGREVAIKVLPPFFATDRQRLRRFEQEARAAAALNHPNILAVFQLGTYEGSPYLVSELLEGESLRARVKRGPIPLPEALDYARQIARGLAAAHEKGIVHRDLKPENLYVTRDGQVKILDFGLAKQTHPDATAQTKPASLATEAGVVMGTVGYMSPEQVRGQTADFRADIFAFGAIMYEMLSGKRAFTGESSADVSSAILKEDPPRLLRSIAGVPRALERIVRRCLEKMPDQRFQSAQELSKALRDMKVKAGAATRTWASLRRHWGLVTTALVLLAVAVAAVASALYFRGRQASIDSIAVTPVAAKNGASGELANGLTAGLIESLSQIPNLRVMSRSSVAHYKGQEIDPQKVGRELNVRAVLTGTLTPRGDSFVLDTELVNASDASHIWGRQFDTKPGEILTAQEELARTLSDKLRPRLSTEAKANLAKSGTSNPEAYSLYVKGLYSFDSYDTQHLREALAYFQQAIEKAPVFAQAYGGLGDTYAFLVNFRAIPFREGLQKAKAAARRALELDSNLAEGHCALGLASHISWEWEQAEQEARRCVELGPNLFWAHQSYALILADNGKMAQAEQKIATELDPVSYMATWFLGNAYYFSREYDRSIEQRLKLIELEPDRPDQHYGVADCYARKGEYDKAALEYQEELKVEGKPDQAEALRRAYGKDGFHGVLKAQIQLWSDPERAEYSPYSVAGNYSLIGDRENAFLWLNRAYTDNERIGITNGDLVVIQVDPAFDNIRSDPRFKSFLRRMGFPQ